jgi:hypothetical protein
MLFRVLILSSGPRILLVLLWLVEHVACPGLGEKILRIGGLGL